VWFQKFLLGSGFGLLVVEEPWFSIFLKEKQFKAFAQ
jgi:hypothetical protein